MKYVVMQQVSSWAPSPVAVCNTPETAMGYISDALIKRCLDSSYHSPVELPPRYYFVPTYADEAIGYPIP